MTPRITAAVALLIVLCGCDNRVPPFHDFTGVSRVHVMGLGGRDTLRTLLAPDSIAALLRFVNARNSDWGQPWSGVPVPKVTAYFFGADFQGSFGAGPDFFETQRAGTFASRVATSSELAEFARLVGVPRERVRAEHR